MMAASCVPVASVPSGYTQDLEHPTTNHRTAGIAISITVMVIATLFLITRVYTKTFLSHTFGGDDVSLVLAWVASIALQIMMVYLFAQEMIGVHLWDLCLYELRLSILLMDIGSLLYVPLMALTKLSLLLFYRKLSMDRWFKIAVHAVMALILSYSIALALSLIFACSPMRKNWDITVQAGHCISKGKIYLAIAGLNAVTDVILLILPLPMIWKLSVPLVQKIGLACIFGIGSLTLVTSLIRLALLSITTKATDATWAISTPMIWICIEANLSIICGCLPITRLFFRHVAPRLIGEHPETAASVPSSRRKKPIRSVAELSNLSSTQRRQASQKHYGRLSEWDEFWEKNMGRDAESEICTVDPTGRVVASPKSKKRASVPTWVGVLPEVEADPIPPPLTTFVVGRGDDGRYSLRPNGG